MVDDAVDHRGCDGVVAEDISPSGKGHVGSQDDAGVLVTAGDQLEEQVRCLGSEGDVADFTDDEQRAAT